MGQSVFVFLISNEKFKSTRIILALDSRLAHFNRGASDRELLDLESCEVIESSTEVDVVLPINLGTGTIGSKNVSLF